jgi:hypothetical protein
VKIFLVVLFLVCFTTCHAIVLQEGNWAWNCNFPYFPSINLCSVPSFAEGCYKTCQQLPVCTHFMWTDLNGGTCSYKTGVVTKINAVDSWLLAEFQWFGSICGILPK